MHYRVIILLIIFLYFISGGCVERYYPEEDNLKTGTLVINAHLTDHIGIQEVEISRSSSLINSVYDPESGCYVELERDNGETRVFNEFRPGSYRCDLQPDFLETGFSYRLHVMTPDGKEYESEFEKLRPVPAIDSLYYITETRSYETEADSLNGIRFYLDFTYDNDEYEYIRWDLTETYEFHNPDMKGFILDKDFQLKALTDTNNYRTCWITNDIKTIFSMSLKILEKGTYIKKPFDFVPNIQQEQKLHHKYSLFVRQYSVSQAAFNYWNELKKTSQELGWLFDRQPALLVSNICNVNDPDEVILGFFSMSGMVEKRAFAENIEGLDTNPYKYYCFPRISPGGGFYMEEDLPVYFARVWMNGEQFYGEVNKHCVDCRAYKNSSHIKPVFW